MFANFETPNAYVSGLKDDLDFNSNQLVDLNAMYIAGAVIGQIPFTFLFPIFPMNYTIPALEIGWGIFTLLQFRTQSFAELMAYRFLVGLFEASYACFSGQFLILTSNHRPRSFQVYIMSWGHGIVATRLPAVVEFFALARC